MLTPHGVEAGKVYGGRPTLTPQDVAGMMVNLPHREAELLMAKHAGYPRHRIRAYWLAHVRAQRWSAKSSRVVKLAILTLDEHIDEPRCRACEGTKGLIIDNQWQNCPACHGAGIKRLSNRQVSELLNFHSNALKPRWADRLNWCRRELQAWELEALSKVQP